jgi:hypothetical protein
MHTTGLKQAVRNAFFRLGLHTPPKGVVHALNEQGIQVDELLVQQVQFEMLKETTGARIGKASRPVTSPAMRRRPKAFPEKQGRGPSR